MEGKVSDTVNDHDLWLWKKVLRALGGVPVEVAAGHVDAAERRLREDCGQWLAGYPLVAHSNRFE